MSFFGKKRSGGKCGGYKKGGGMKSKLGSMTKSHGLLGNPGVNGMTPITQKVKKGRGTKMK